MSLTDVINKHKGFNDGLKKDISDNLTQTVVINSNDVSCYISDTRDAFTDADSLSLISLSTENISIGDIVNYFDNKWIVVTEEPTYTDDYNKFIISKINYTLNYKHVDGTDNIDCIVLNNNNATVEKNDKFIILNKDLNIVVTDNSVTKRIETNQEININHYLYKVIHVDDLSYDGITVLICNFIGYDYDTTETIDDLSTISGSEYASVNGTEKYLMDKDVTWDLSNANATIVSSDNREALVRFDNGGTVDLIADDGTKQFIKTIKINSNLF